MQTQFVAYKRGAQRIFQLQCACRMDLHFSREKFVVVAPIVLGAVHRDIGALRKRFKILAVVGVHRDADRRRDDQFMLFDSAETGDSLQQFFGHMRRTVGIGVRQQQDELIPAQARHRVFLAHRRFQTLCDLYQQRVADAVAEVVVDVLEVIKIEKHHDQLGAAALRHVERMADTVGEQRPVWQTGEQIEMRQLLDLLLVPLALGDVIYPCDNVIQASVGIANRTRRPAHINDGPILADKTVFDRIFV